MTATTKRKTATRKPAAKRAVSNGQQNGTAPTNGHAVPQPPVEFVPRDPEESLELVAGPEVPAHSYGDRRIQVFTTAEGEQIVVPHISTVPVTEEFLWDNHRQKLDLMHQSWAWMNLAGIPLEDQRRLIKLEVSEKKRFWQEWFQGFVPPLSGEPPGES